MQTTTEIIVQEVDLDYLGHVNYNKYIAYLEQGVGDWYDGVGVSHAYLAENKIGTVLVKLEVSYLKEARLGDLLRVVTTPSKVGTKSFVMRQEIYNQRDELITESTKIFVMFNISSRKSTPVIEQIRSGFVDED
ncbi:thioesterase family protein [Neobacillus novalis]|uniref:Thioesterase family protein n=1 Tax=Neobacillus novalis TaxID=220687 RepID=A0AA95MKV2_9BACI|nr:thioesterase family protein [Neobacillus novalis]WHY83978.1 thioesterase family protein [Neobacillus novalis]